MAQVVTNENMLDFIQNRQVPEFKAPEAKVEVLAEKAAPNPDQPKDLTTGKFVSADGEKAPKEQAEKPEGEKTEPAAQAADDDHDDDGAKLSDAVKRKIDKIVAKKHRAMKEAEEFGREEYRERKAAVERAEALQREIDALKAAKSGTGPASDKGDKPKPEDFKTVGEYTDALVEWKFNQRVKTQEADDAKKQQTKAIETVQAQFGERVAAVAKEIPDYNQVIEAADWDVPYHMQAYFVDSEMGPHVGYHLAKHREEFDRIAKLSPVRAFAELGKLEDKLKAKAPVKDPAPANTQVSRAPAPITPLEGKSTTVAKDPSQMSFAELRAHRQAERAAGKNR
jgi:hypothetical protein